MSDLNAIEGALTTTSTQALTLQQLAAHHGLSRVGGRPHLSRYLGETWLRRRLAWQLAKSRYHADSSRTRLGRAWNILNPLLEVVLYGIIYYYLMGAGRRPGNYTAFVTIGAVTFQFISKGMTAGARSIEANSGLIRSIRFPRTVLPVAVIMQNLMDLIPTMCLIIPIAVVTGEPVTARWFLLIPALILAGLFSLGLGFFFAWLTSHFRDTLQLLPHGTRVLFHASGIFFAINQFGDVEWLRQVMGANPFGWFLNLTRAALMSEGDVVQQASISAWLITTATTVLTLLVGFLLFWSGEERYGRD